MGYRILFSFLVVLSFAEVSSAATVLSFAKWKARRVQEAKSLHQQISADITRINKNDKEKMDLEKARLSQAKLNIDIANELTAADYFVLYLVKTYSGNRRAIMKAIKSMKPGDIADILSAYEQTLKKRHDPDVVDSVGHLLPGVQRARVY